MIVHSVNSKTLNENIIIIGICDEYEYLLCSIDYNLEKRNISFIRVYDNAGACSIADSSLQRVINCYIDNDRKWPYDRAVVF